MRLFIGIELQDDVRAALTGLQARLREVSPDSKWVAPEKAHLTLAFLGEVTEDRLQSLESAVGDAVGHHEPFTLQLEGGGAFGGKSRPRVLWVAVKGDLAKLGDAQAAVAAAVRGLQLPLEDRPYTAHLTLARARHPRGDAGLSQCLPLLEGQTVGTVPVKHVSLFRSHTSNKGSTYEVLRRWPFSR